MRNLIILIFIVLNITNFQSVYSQKQFYNWYFGRNAGITFNTSDTEPINLVGGQINTWEGCATFSDNDGNLLFYTDGQTVYNSKHQVMKNGEQLMGCYSATSSAVVIPAPSKPNIYYIFTVDCRENYSSNKGFQYSTVDISKNNGDGEVIQKNFLLNNYASEKIAAVKHSNQKDFWVVTYEHINNKFHSFLVDENGVNPNPVSSNCATRVNMAQGHYMKFSGDGNLLASADQEADEFVVYDFNRTTGTFSTKFILGKINWPYGVEFSKSGRFLYVSTFQNCYLYQFDLSLNNSAEIFNNKVMLSTRAVTFYFGALQMGPNGKIYVAKDGDNSLGVINEPDKPGAECLYSENGFLLNSGKSGLGLPTFYNESCPQYNFSLIDSITTCPNKEVKISIDNDNNFEYSWSPINCIDNPDSNSITLKTPVSKKYTVTLKNKTDGCSYSKSVYIKIRDTSGIAISGKNIICDDFTELSIDESLSDIKWSNGESTSRINADKAGTYIVTAKDVDGCFVKGVIEVFKAKDINLQISGDSSICEGVEAELKIEGNFKDITWFDGSKSKSVRINKPGKYWVKVISQYDCEYYAEKIVSDYNLNLPELSEIDFGELCLNSELTLSKIFNLPGIGNIKIDKATLAGTSGNFTLLNSDDIIGKVVDRLSVNLKCHYNSKINHDTLIFEISEPCKSLLKIPLTFSLKPSVVSVFSIDTVTAYMNEFCLPIFGVFDCKGATTTNIDYEMTLKIHSHNFKPEFVKFGNIKNIELIDGWYYVTIIHNNCEISSDTTVINYICGTVVHADSSISIVEITDFKTSNDIETILGDGSVGGNTCMRDFRYLMNFRQSKLIVSSGFEQSIITCKTQEIGNFRFEIADVSGNIILSRQLTKNEKNYEDLKIYIDNNDIANGVYFVIVRTPWNILREKLIITK